MFKDAKNYEISLKGKYVRTAEHRKGKKHTPEDIEKIKQNRRNNKYTKKGKVRAVHTPKGVFATKNEAKEAFGFMCQGSVGNKCDSKAPQWSEWYYVDTGPTEIDESLSVSAVRSRAAKERWDMVKQGKIAPQPRGKNGAYKAK